MADEQKIEKVDAELAPTPELQDKKAKTVEAPVKEAPVKEETKIESSVGTLSEIPEETVKNEVQAMDFEVSIMALDDKTKVLSITTDLGTGYASVLGTVAGGIDALTTIANARQTVNTNMISTEYDNAAALASSFRTVEKKITSDVQPVMKACCVALETYSKAAYLSKKFRDKWNATSTGVNDPFFTSNFRKLWRDQMAEELIVKVGTVTKASGTWPATITSVHDVADVKAATTGVLPNTPTYANGTAGVGATLTAGANAALAAQDGITLAAGDRILVQNQASTLQNGIYVVASIGSASVPWMLVRATDSDTASASEVSYGMATYVTAGSTNGSKKFYMSNNAAITMGTTALTFTQTTMCGISLNVNLEVRIVGNGNAATTDDIIATLVVQKADLTTSLQTVTIPTGSSVGTRFAIGTSAITGATVSAVSIASDNGVDGDMLEIWVKSAA